MSSTKQTFSKSSSKLFHSIRPTWCWTTLHQFGCFYTFSVFKVFLSSSCACRSRHEIRSLTSLGELLPLFYTPHHQELLSMAIIINGKISLNISITHQALPWFHLRWDNSYYASQLRLNAPSSLQYCQHAANRVLQLFSCNLERLLAQPSSNGNDSAISSYQRRFRYLETTESSLG